MNCLGKVHPQEKIGEGGSGFDQPSGHSPDKKKTLAIDSRRRRVVKLGEVIEE